MNKERIEKNYSLIKEYKWNERISYMSVSASS
jgi:hypothetical protein